jgi:hypothetical protein
MTARKALSLKTATRIAAVAALSLVLWLPVLFGVAHASSLGPVANAGLPQFVSLGATVRLDGSLSTSATGAPLTYQWSLVSVPSNSTATLANPAAVVTTFVVDEAGAYMVQLAVSDGSTSSTSQVVISTQETPPVVNAGSNQSVTSGSVVRLDGSGSSEPDGDSLTFQWSLVAMPAGSQTSISTPVAVAPTFFADLAGTYVAQLTVLDAHGNNSTSTVTVSSQELPPIARAGQGQSVTVGATVQLDGSASSDPDGDAITYSWSILFKPSGSTASLSSAGIVDPTFVVDVAGTYVVQLTVSDSHGNVSLATVEVTTDKIPPLANAGAAQSVTLGSTVQLDGSKSTGNAPLQYRWTLIAKPSGSTAAVAGGGLSPTASFTADQAGQYLVQLQVSDGVFTGPPDTVLITATAAGPNLVISPDPVSFGNQAVGTTSNPVGVTITNLGTTNVQLTSFLLAGVNASEFATRGLDSIALAPNKGFIFSVLFTPQALGTRSATLIIYDSTGGMHVVPLSGIGGSSPAIQFSPGSLIFPDQAVGTTSAPLQLAVTNTGTAVLQMTGLGFGGSNPGDFGWPATFTPPIPATPITVAANGGSTSVPVVFKPTVAGQRVATLLLTDNASGSPQSVALSGNGTSSQPPGINVTPANIVFANETVGTTSAASPVTVTNTTTTAAQITALTFSGPNVSDFSTPATTPIPVAANGGTATIAVTFTPSAAGTRTATLTVADNSGGSPHTVFLSGTGTAAGPGISVSPTSLNFGNQALNVTATLPVTVSNTGGTTANVTGMLLAGLNASSFNVLGSRSFPLTAGSSATITVQFTPPTLGSLTATLLINNDVGSALVVTLSGVGGTSSPAIQLSPTSLSFGSLAVGTTSAPLQLAVTNTGNACAADQRPGLRWKQSGGLRISRDLHPSQRSVADQCGGQRRLDHHSRGV